MVITKTQTLYLETPAASIALSPDEKLLAVVGSHLFKVYTVRDNGELDEHINMRSSKNQNLNYSSSDVEFCPSDDRILASASTNGSVIIWNITKSGRAKLANLFKDHDRTVNRVNFHPSDPNLVLSGSQDGQMKLFDYRKNESVQTFSSNSESVRDIQFNPYITHYFAAGTDSCNVQLWDIRRPDKYERLITGHRGPVFALDWHPKDRHCIATASRDCTIKIWDVSETATVTSAITTIAAIAKVKWRPEHYYHLASCSLTVDSSACIWDVQRPFVPIASFACHKESTSALQWRQMSNSFITVSKEGRLFHHCLADAHQPHLRGCPSPMAMSPRGIMAYSAPTRARNKERRLIVDPPLPVQHKRQTSLTNPLSGSTPSSPATPIGPSSFTPYDRIPSTPLNPETPTLLPNPNNNADLNLNILNFPPLHLGMRDLATFEDIGPILSEFTLLNIKDDSISVDTIRDYGQNYLLDGSTDQQLFASCQHNAALAAKNKRPQEESMWQLLSVICLGGLTPSVAASNDTAPLSPALDTTPTAAANSSKLKDDITCSDNTVPMRSPNDDADCDDKTIMNEDGDDSQTDEELDDRLAGQNAKFSSMFSNGRITQNELYFGDGDFYADLQTRPHSRQKGNRFSQQQKKSNYFGPIYNDFGMDRGLSSNEELFMEQNEAFEPDNLHSYLQAQNKDVNNGFADEDLHHSLDSSGDGDSGETDNCCSDSCVLAVTMPLSISPTALPKPPVFDYTASIIEALQFTADRGDIATCVTAVIILGERLKQKLSLDLMEHWFLTYIDQLQRLMLFNRATVIIQSAHGLPNVQQLNQNSTVITILCPQCHTRLPPRAFCCRKCRQVVNKCSWCQQVVSGLYVMCQGCCHGGHLHHLADWFKDAPPKTVTGDAASTPGESSSRHSSHSSISNVANGVHAKTGTTNVHMYNGNPFLGAQVTSNIFADPSTSSTTNFTQMGNLVCPAGCGHLCQYM